MPKRRIQDFLLKIGAYDRMRETFAYDCYRRWKHGYSIFWRRNEYLLFRSLFGTLPRDQLIFDIGASRGQRTAIFVRLGARVVAVEPDASNQRLLERRFLHRWFRRPRVIIVGKAVSDTSAAATMWVHRPGSGLNSLSRKWVGALGHETGRFGGEVRFKSQQRVETTTLEALMVTFGTPHYIKIDVEGYELSALRGLRSPVPFVSFELILPEMLDEGLECVEVLRRLSGNGQFNWFVDFRPGFSLAEWLGPAAFKSALRGCRESTVEVFWRNSV